MDLHRIRKEIEHMRRQIDRQRNDIRSLEKHGIATTSARELLARMQDRVQVLMLQRDEALLKDAPKYPGTKKVINGTPARRRA